MKRPFQLLALLLLLALICSPARVCALSQPSVSAASAVVMDATTGVTLFEKNAHQIRSMASTTKIMTTLLALEQGDLSRTIVTTKEMVTVEGSGMGLQVGDSVTLEGLCYGMMLSSGNDAANTVAIALCGSLPAFAEKMNQKAAHLGMKNTHFVTPSGLDATGHSSTAYDMALLTRHALGNSLFAQMAKCQRKAVYYGNPPYRRTLSNHNRLLKEYEGCIGVKTGFTKRSGRCLVSAAVRDGATLICVTLSAPDDWNDHKRLLDYGFEQMQPVEHEGGACRIPVTGGTAPSVSVNYGRLQVSLPAKLKDEAVFQVQTPPFLYAPVSRGKVVGTAAFLINGNPVASVAVVTTQSVSRAPAPPTFWQRLCRNLGYFLLS